MRAIVIGAGHNGLVAACYLAKSGVKTTVFESRSEIGGGAITTEIHPGFRCPALTHEVLLQQRIVRELDLTRHGLELLPAVDQVCSLSAAGPLVISDDAAKTRDSVRSFSARDADALPQFQTAVRRVASVLASTFEYAPPPIDKPGAVDLWNLLKTGRAFRSLGRRDGHRLLRWGPMPVADLVGEWFESDLVRATIAAPALTGTMMGPRSAGSSLMLLMREANRQLAGGRPLAARGGPGAVTAALAAAARTAGVDIKASSPVSEIIVGDGSARGIVANGRTFEADVVVSGADPKTTLLGLIDPAALSPDFALRTQHYRASGTVAKVNLALRELPSFGCADEMLRGRIQVGPELDYLERAFDHVKYGEISTQPWLELTIPSLLDPALAPPGAHVASIYVHYAPYRLRSLDWNEGRDVLLEHTLEVLERHAPRLRAAVVHAQVIGPADMETEYGTPREYMDGFVAGAGGEGGGRRSHSASTTGHGRRRR